MQSLKSTFRQIYILSNYNLRRKVCLKIAITCPFYFLNPVCHCESANPKLQLGQTNSLVCCHSSRLYLTGTWRRFSNSNAGSTLSSFPAAFRNAFVQRTLRGLRFFLNALWHFVRQNRNTYNKMHKMDSTVTKFSSRYFGRPQ